MLIPGSIEIGGVACNESLVNLVQRCTDWQYSACAGRAQWWFSAQMSTESRLAIFGSGPLGGGRIVSVSMWFKQIMTKTRWCYATTVNRGVLFLRGKTICC
jgi:hypothetical protein